MLKQHRSTPSHTPRTPQNTHQHHNPSNWRHCTQIWQVRNAHARPHPKHPQVLTTHTTQARTDPAATITTPELSPDTATGVFRLFVVPSPSCAPHKKASQPHHKPNHPSSRSPLGPSPQNALAPSQRGCTPNTISLRTTPQSHTCDTANARVSSEHSSPSHIHLR